MAGGWNAAWTRVLSLVSWKSQRWLSRVMIGLSKRGPRTGMPRAPTVSHTPMNRIRESYEYARRNRVDATPLGLSAELRYRAQASSIRSAFSRLKNPQLRTTPARVPSEKAPRLNPNKYRQSPDS